LWQCCPSRPRLPPCRVSGSRTASRPAAGSLASSSWIPHQSFRPACARPCHELDEATAALVPDTAIGRLLDQDKAAKLIRRLERGIPKRPAVASVRRAAVQPARRGCVHSGDTYWNGIYPFIDYSTGGNIDGMIKAAEVNDAAVTDKTIVIPGHGNPVSNKGEALGLSGHACHDPRQGREAQAAGALAR
jgi:hypothetical protein